MVYASFRLFKRSLIDSKVWTLIFEGWGRRVRVLYSVLVGFFTGQHSRRIQQQRLGSRTLSCKMDADADMLLRTRNGDIVFTVNCYWSLHVVVIVID